MDWFLYDNGLRHERVQVVHASLVNLRQFFFVILSDLDMFCFSTFSNEIWSNNFKALRSSLLKRLRRLLRSVTYGSVRVVDDMSLVSLW